MDGSATFAMASGRLATAEATINVARTSPALAGTVEGISAGATAAVFAAIFLFSFRGHSDVYATGFICVMGGFTSCVAQIPILLAGV